MDIPQKYKDRFLSRVKSGGVIECWPWILGLDHYGYGQFSIGTKKIKAHRMAYELAKGPIPIGLCVLHECDNPKCCNPSHLTTGTHKLNSEQAVMRDRVSRGKRHSLTQRGEGNGRSKLTEADVLEIRRLHASKEATYSEIIKKFKVAKSLVGRILSRESWSHI